MKKKFTTAKIRADGTVVRVSPDGREEPLSMTAIPPKTEAEIEAAAADDIENPPLSPEQLKRLRPVPRVKTLRRALGLTQEEFASRYGIPIGTLRDWEQGRTEPDQAARAYLNLIARDPLTAARSAREPDSDGASTELPTFQVGQRVHLKASSSLQGAVIEVRSRASGGFYYKVFHSADLVREYDEEQLAASEKERSLEDALVSGEFLDSGTFRARLTASRIIPPNLDNIYALYAARIQHVPFQFKPLLRLLRADRPRLLVADEVGVGKTIEAGLILKELEARQRIERVLIVCPKDLTQKWRAEMRRFDENFQILGADQLRYCVRETDLDGVWPQNYSRSIVNIELLRLGEYLWGTQNGHVEPGLATLQPSPRFDLLIVDEAHHLRNPDTNSFELGQFICDVSEAVVFLSATPLHTGSHNLYALLSLLRPELFPTKEVFEEMLEPNPYLLQAMRHVRARTPKDTWASVAAESLDQAADTSWGRRVLTGEPRFEAWRDRLSESRTLSDDERIRCLRDLEDLHTLSHVVNRTRRRDIGRFTIREPATIAVPHTPEQASFYAELIAFRRAVLSLHLDPRTVALVATTLERQAASCLPALIPLLNVFLRTGRFAGSALSDDVEASYDEVALPSDLVDKAHQLRHLAAGLPPEDPKLDQLVSIVRTAIETPGPGKVLVFSYFLHTLNYLRAELQKRGIRVGLVTGQVPDELPLRSGGEQVLTREQLRGRFRLAREHKDALDVLLSSEVGCEGLDYEFCDRLVNYDIPWNPMRIEQRIGRIDRFGQQSEKVHIFNFITPGTIEERVFFRCFERLGIFKDTIGDLEEVLGDVLQDLTKMALNPGLTPEQAEEKARQLADNAIRQVEEQRRLEDEGASLFGLDPGAWEIGDIESQGRFVAPDELFQLVEKFVSRSELQGRLTRDESTPGLVNLRLNKEGRAEVIQRVRSISDGTRAGDRSTLAFLRWLEGNEPYLSMTFDQRTALERRDLPFVTPLHVLAKLAALDHMTGGPFVSRLKIREESVPSGRFLFVCELWEAIGAQRDTRLRGFAWDLERGTLASDVSANLIKLLSRTADSSSPPDPIVAIHEGLAAVDEASRGSRLAEIEDLRQRNEAVIARKLASLDAYHQNRLARVDAELQQATDERIIRMKTAERARIESDHEEKRREIEAARNADIASKRIAAGVLEINHGN